MYNFPQVQTWSKDGQRVVAFMSDFAEALHNYPPDQTDMWKDATVLMVEWEKCFRKLNVFSLFSDPLRGVRDQTKEFAKKWQFKRYLALLN